MSGHSFELRAALRYSGDDNHLDQIDAEVLTDQGWKPLQIENGSPGFLLFVYSFLICQHTYFHANSTEHALPLESVSLALSLTAAGMENPENQYRYRLEAARRHC